LSNQKAEPAVDWQSSKTGAPVEVAEPRRAALSSLGSRERQVVCACSRHLLIDSQCELTVPELLLRKQNFALSFAGDEDSLLTRRWVRTFNDEKNPWRFLSYIFLIRRFAQCFGPGIGQDRLSGRGSFTPIRKIMRGQNVLKARFILVINRRLRDVSDEVVEILKDTVSAFRELLTGLERRERLLARAIR